MASKAMTKDTTVIPEAAEKATLASERGPGERTNFKHYAPAFC